MQQINSRIKQRHDTLANWTNNNIVLLEGELAIVDCGEQTKLKVGNGLSTFNQLPFIDQEVLSTKWVAAHAISQGIHAQSVPYGLAAGAFLSAGANFSQALGYNAETLSSDQYSFVWNGNSSSPIGERYQSHGQGTFSINPESGASGVYIGEQALPEVISNYVPTDLSAFTNSQGYVVSNDIQTTLGSISKALIAQIEAPKASVNSIQQTLLQLLSILSGGTVS